MSSQATPADAKAPEVFDVANWLDRATTLRPGTSSGYVPKHRADGPAD